MSSHSGKLCRKRRSSWSPRYPGERTRLHRRRYLGDMRKIRHCSRPAGWYRLSRKRRNSWDRRNSRARTCRNIRFHRLRKSTCRCCNSRFPPWGTHCCMRRNCACRTGCRYSLNHKPSVRWDNCSGHSHRIAPRCIYCHTPRSCWDPLTHRYSARCRTADARGRWFAP